MAVNLSKGQKIDLTKSNPALKKIIIGLGWSAGQEIDLDTAAFLLNKNEKVESDEDFVFYGNLRHKSGSVEHSGDKLTGGEGDVEQINIDLSKVPVSVEKIAFTATIYDAEERNQTFGQVRNAYIRVINKDTRTELLNFNLEENLSVETAIVVAEIYRYKGEWKFNAVGAGFTGGLESLCNNFGVEISDDNSAQSSFVGDSFSQPNKIELRKGQKVNLAKTNLNSGELVINLNWSRRLRNIDLDLGCLYELKNYRKGSVQALGDNFGYLEHEPYISLDNDDRSGDNTQGENIRVNAKHIKDIKRILVYTYIYDGVASWREVDGVVTIKCPNNPDVVVRMDEYGSEKTLCGIALLENTGESFTVEKIVRFYDSQRYLDLDFNWGLNWVAGRKDQP